MINKSQKYLPPHPDTEFIDTFVFANGRILYKELHIERTFETFQYLKAPLTISEVQDAYDRMESIYNGQESADRIFRITLNKNNFKNVVPEIRELTYHREIELTPVLGFKYSQANPRFKWADRSHWRTYSHLMPHEWQDILAADRNGFVSECSRFSLFAYDSQNDVAYTPPDESGCLKGVLREFLLRQGSVQFPSGTTCRLHVKNLHLDELQNFEIFVGNSVRGLIPARFTTYLV